MALVTDPISIVEATAIEKQIERAERSRQSSVLISTRAARVMFDFALGREAENIEQLKDDLEVAEENERDASGEADDAKDKLSDLRREYSLAEDELNEAKRRIRRLELEIAELKKGRAA